MTHDKDCLDPPYFFKRGINIGFQRHGFAPAQATVSADYKAAGTIFNPSRNRFGREPSEDNAVHGPDARAS